MKADYTLAEVKEICKASHCEQCLLNPAKRPMCPLNAAPQFWDLSAGEPDGRGGQVGGKERGHGSH